MKLALFNLENFFLNQSLDKKPIDKVEWIARITKDISPDIFMLCEVGGMDSLTVFNDKYLNSEYLPFLIPGNSKRGIEIGYLINKNLPYMFRHISHKDKTFSRDVSEIQVLKNNKPVMITLLVHLKSKWDREGNDPNGFLKRSHEVGMLLEIYRERKMAFPDCPIILSGDMNGTAQKDNCEREFREIYQKTNFIDVLEILDIPAKSRVSHIHFGKDNNPEPFQLDYIFLPITLKDKVIKEESGIYLFKNLEGTPLPLPQTPYERYALPSDHYPVVLTLDFL